MTDFSYNQLKQLFLDLREDWMPTDSPAFQPSPGDNVSDANSKIYTDKQMKSAKHYFMDYKFYNPFCGRINCWNINLKHVHTVRETKSEYVEKIVKLLEEWEGEAVSELDPDEMNQLTQCIQLWKKENSFEVQRKALLDHWKQTVFNNWHKQQRCWDIVDRLAYKIDDESITDDSNQPPDDPNDHELCSVCLVRYNVAAETWEDNYRQEIDKNCRRGLHYPISHISEQKIHGKCWKKIKKNEYNDIQPCGCSNVKQSELLELTSQNLVKSFFILNNVKSIKKVTQINGSIGIEYLDGHSQEVKSSQEVEDFEDLKTYLQSFPVGQEITRRDLGIVEQDDPNTDKNLEETRKKLLDYFKKRKIRSIDLENGELVIEYQNSTIETKAITTPELQLIQSYCQSKGITSLTLGDLERNNTQQPRNNKPLFYAAAVVLVAVVIGLIAYLAYQSKKNSRRR